MRGFPIASEKFLSLRCASEPEAKTVYESGEIAKDRTTGFPVWLVGVTVRVPEERRAEVIDVQVVGQTKPAVAEGDLLNIRNLTVSQWENNGRSGITLRADSITVVAASAASTLIKGGKGGES